MSDFIQNIQRGTEAALRTRGSRRGFLHTGALALGAAANLADFDGIQFGIQALQSGILVASDARTQRTAAAAQVCEPLPTDGRPPLCTTTDTALWAQSYFGGFYFEDRNGNEKYEPKDGDEAIQGVKARQILVEEIAFSGWGDFVQLNPASRTIHPDGRVSYQDVKAGKNSGERFVEKWTIFKLPAEDGGKGIGFDLRTGRDRLYVTVDANTTVDKVWGPIDNEARHNRVDRNECKGACGWNCVRFIQFSRLIAAASPDLNSVVSDEMIHKDKNNGRISSYTDFLWLWQSAELSEKHFDYNRISTPLTDALRASEKVVKSEVIIPKDTVSYDNYTR